MANPLTGILSGSIGSIIESVGGVIDKLSTSKEEKLAAQIELTKIERAAQLEALKVEAQLVASQAEVIVAEAKGSWLAGNWRPILMLTFTYIIAHNYIIAPLFSIASVPIPPEMWELLKLGIGGYIIGRTGEKIVEQYKK